MLTARHLATIRAALLFWQEEMHTPQAMLSYFDEGIGALLLPGEIDVLRRTLQLAGLGYIHIDLVSRQLASPLLYTDIDTAQQEVPLGARLATVVLPAH